MDEANNNIWKIESLRLTSFLNNDFNSSPLENWLKAISKNDPLSINKTVNQFQGIAQIGTSMLKLEWKNNRIDLFLNSNAPALEKNIGNYSDITSLMNNFLLSFLDITDCPVSKRLAIGVILYIPIKNIEEATDILQPKLKSVTNIKGTSDFLFRINRPVQSKTMPELKINRLMTWSIAVTQIIKLQVNISQPNIIQQSTSNNSIPELMCRLEMDFNTVDNKVQLSVCEQKEISKELMSMVVEVAEKGEYGID